MILGRQPAIGLAELESLFGSDKVASLGAGAALVDVDPCLLAFDRLGGSIKFCKVLTTLDTTNWGEIEKFLLKVSPGHSQTMVQGKMQLGLSLYGFNETPARIKASGLSLKKAIAKTGRSVRLIPNVEAALNSAQVLHNRLTGPTGWELVFVKSGAQTVVAQTVKVQDITAYSFRDQNRPMRDAKVGMLPPKLAQTIINLAVGEVSDDKLKSICDIPADQMIPLPVLEQTILDPFCGSGVILQEAALMGYETYGTDLEPRMVDYSRKNLAWLAQKHRIAPVCCRVEVGDATNTQWSASVDFVASETYLGRPFTSPPTPEILAQNISDCNLIIKKFLQNIATQLKTGTRLALAVPAWYSRNGFKHLPLIDQIRDLGYNRVSFKHAGEDDLIYHRPGQIVARELLVITRK